jgi:hypothetical protein
MRLTVGERLPGSGPANQPGGYVITAVVRETAWAGLYAGKKIFYNFDFTDKRPREAEDKEWLDVYLRTCQYPYLDDPNYIAGRRALARAEIQRILSSSRSNVWPEPIDLIEVPNTRDPFSLGDKPGLAKLDVLEPIAVFARPQGEPLGRWQQTRPSRSAVLAVLAELLSFLRSVHEEGLILNGLGPDTVLVDGAGRVHYLGADLVVEAHAAAGFPWGLFFPPERYRHGFAAPECFDPAAPRDRRSDVYAWAVVAFFLLTGAAPAQMAQQQGQPWVRFGQAEFALLEKVLLALSQSQVRAWAEQLEVDPAALLAGWPGNFLAVFRQCVAPEVRLRPASAEMLRTWLLTPPPAPPAAALAFRLADDQVRLLFDLGGMGQAARLLVRRALGAPPLSVEEGAVVSEGLPRPWLDDTVPRQPALPASAGPVAEPIYYGAFNGIQRGKEMVWSAVTLAQVFEPTPTNLRLFAEAAAGVSKAPEPAGVALLFQALDGIKVAEALLASPLPVVRLWAVRRLAAIRARNVSSLSGGRPAPEGTDAPRSEDEPTALLWKALADADETIRLEAAAGLLSVDLSPAQVRRVLETLGDGELDAALQAARLLPELGVSKELLNRATAELEAERPAACPVCGRAVPGRERAAHLKSAHGYLECQGALLPRDVALDRLWGRIFLASDVQAHEEILTLLDTSSPQSGERGKRERDAGADSAYSAALAAQLRRRAAGLLQGRSQEVPRLVRCLRADARAHRHFPVLLRDADAQVREIGRHLLLPELGGRLASDQISAEDVRRELDRLVPDDLMEEKILLCQQLPYLGVDAAAVKTCLDRLLAERPVTCTECGQQFPGGQIETHLRQVHRVFEFRGKRRPLQETLAFLLDAVVGARPDPEAWAALQTITREQEGGRADAVLASWLAQKLFALLGEPRQQAAEALAEVIVSSGNGPRLLPLLADVPTEAASRPAAVQLALALAARLPPPVDPALIGVIKPLLGEKQVPVLVRQAALAGLLRTTGTAGPAVRELLMAFVTGIGKESAIRQLTHLEQQVGQLPIIAQLCRELEDQIRMRCTRCSAELRRAQMVKHLWEAHRLVLEGRRVREPWRLIEDWLEDYRLERDPTLLDRCRDLAGRLDPEQGPAHLRRLLLQHGIDDPQVRAELLAEAGRCQASLCPHCYAIVPLAGAVPLAIVEGEEGELAALGYGVYASDYWLIPWLTVETPEGILHDGLQPQWRKTRAGLAPYVAVPWFLLLIALLLFAGLPLLLFLGVVVLAALIFSGIGYLLWPKPPPLQGRAVDAAWSLLAPRLLGDLTPKASAFLAGLARASLGHGSARQRADILAEACAELEEQTKADLSRCRHLAAVRRLLIEDESRRGADRVALLVEQAERSLSGKLPLAFADELFSGIDSTREGAVSRARLRALLCQRAFEHGLECSDLVALSKIYPGLGTALGTEDELDLAQLRLLWWLRKARPWSKLGDVHTIFELVADRKASGKCLEQCPDLLLAVEGSPPLFVGVHGIFFEETWISEPPVSVGVVPRADAGWNVLVGPHRFRVRANADDVANRLERWLRYYFHDFLPQADSARRWRSPGALASLAARNGLKCPECRRRVLPRLGDVGLLLEEAAA